MTYNQTQKLKKGDIVYDCVSRLKICHIDLTRKYPYQVRYLNDFGQESIGDAWVPQSFFRYYHKA